MDLDLHLLCSFLNFSAMVHYVFMATISGMLANLADLLDELLDSLAALLFVSAQAGLTTSFDVLGLAISNSFGSIAAGGAVMTCFDLTSTRLQSFLGVFLDLLVELVDCFSHFLMAFCIVLSFLTSTDNFHDLLGNFLQSGASMLLFFFDKMFLEFLSFSFLVFFLVSQTSFVANFLEFVDFGDEFVNLLDGLIAMFFYFLFAFFVLAESDDLGESLMFEFLVSSFQLFLGVFLELLEFCFHNFDDSFVAFLERFSSFSTANEFGDLVTRVSDGFFDLFLVVFENFLFEMFVNFGFFDNANLDLGLLDSLHNFIAILLDLFFAFSFSVLSNLADLLDEFLGFLLDLFLVSAQAGFVADFDVLGLAISDGFGSIAAGGAVIFCLNMASTSLQSFLGVFLDLLVELVDCFSHFLMAFCIVLSFLTSTSCLYDLFCGLFDSFVTALLLFLDQ